MTDEGESLRTLMDRGLCPDCRYRGFVLGPRGGASINVECGNLDCRQRFNVTTFGGNVVRVERIDFNGVWGSEPLA